VVAHEAASGKRICKHWKKDQCEEAVMAHEVVAQHCCCALPDVQLTKKESMNIVKTRLM